PMPILSQGEFYLLPITPVRCLSLRAYARQREPDLELTDANASRENRSWMVEKRSKSASLSALLCRSVQCPQYPYMTCLNKSVRLEHPISRRWAWPICLGFNIRNSRKLQGFIAIRSGDVTTLQSCKRSYVI